MCVSLYTVCFQVQKSQNHYAQIKYVLKMPLTLASLSKCYSLWTSYLHRNYGSVFTPGYSTFNETCIALSYKFRDNDTEGKNTSKNEEKTAKDVMRVEETRTNVVKVYIWRLYKKSLKASHDFHQLEINDCSTSQDGKKTKRIIQMTSEP